MRRFAHLSLDRIPDKTTIFNFHAKRDQERRR